MWPGQYFVSLHCVFVPTLLMESIAMTNTAEALHDYELIQQIGTGSFGLVYLVKRPIDERAPELLVMKQISLTKLDAKQRLDAQKEITLLSTLIHPNIVSYRESFQTESQHLHIIMDYCDGGDLYRKIVERKRNNSGPFTERQLMNWFVQVCLALKFIHERKILHRDLKTQNIFTCDGDSVVKLGDFGIARILDHTADLAATCIGTPYYLSPEVCQNRPYGTKTDVWALGCVLYELATFRHPFEGNHITELLTKIVRGTYDPLPLVHSSRLKYLISQMLKVNSNDRPDVNKLFQRDYVYDHAVNYLKRAQRLDELSMLEDLMKRKRSQQSKVGIKADLVHRHSGFNLTRRKSNPNSQRALEKFRMYLPAAVRTPPSRDSGRVKVSRGRQKSSECQIPMDPVPPDTCTPTGTMCSDGIKDSKIEAPVPEKALGTRAPVSESVFGSGTSRGERSFGATFTLEKTRDGTDAAEATGSPTPTKQKKRVRKRWAMIRPPTTLMKSEVEKLDSTKELSVTEKASASKSLKEKASVPILSKAASPATSSMPPLPGSVNDGWSADETQVCVKCAKPFLCFRRGGSGTSNKQCRSCQRVRKSKAGSYSRDETSVFEKIECLRQELEARLGFERFAELYKSNKIKKKIELGINDTLDEATREKLQNLVFLERAYVD